MFWKLLIEKENLNPKETLIIGDNKQDDCKMPKQFGFNTCHLESPDKIDAVLD